MYKAKYYDTKPILYATIPEAINIFRMNRKLLLKLAKKHGALVTVSNRVKRIDIEKLREGLEKDSEDILNCD